VVDGVPFVLDDKDIKGFEINQNAVVARPTLRQTGLSTVR